MQADPRHQELGPGLLALLGSGSFALHASGWAGQGPCLGGLLAVALQNNWAARTSSPSSRSRPSAPRFFRVRMLLAMIVSAVLIGRLWQTHPAVRSVDLFVAGVLAVDAVTRFRRAVLAREPLLPV